jgi:ketosteroid isomerase-like protein
MKPLTFEAFDHWMHAYGKASKNNDAKASADLFAPDARYYESPFDEPMVGRQAIREYWEKGAQSLKDKESTYEIFAVKDNLGIARWQSQFTGIKTGKRLALDCLFLVEFDEDVKCSLFREWWHLKTLDASA